MFIGLAPAATGAFLLPLPRLPKERPHIDSTNPRDYWYRLKKRTLEESGVDLSTICRQLKFVAKDGKTYKYDAADNEAIFRIIQSIPSPKAEPFKLWLARLGKERIEEIEKPEKAIDRAKSYYEAKQRNPEWVDLRMNSIVTRNNLTDYWKSSGVKDKEYAILTNQIYTSTFGFTAVQYKSHKGIKKNDSLRYPERQSPGQQQGLFCGV